MSLLDYTNKNVVGIVEYQKLLKKEIYRVKLFTSDKNKCLVIKRKDNYIYRNNLVFVLSSIGLTISSCLFKARIETISDLLSTNTKLYYMSQYLWLSMNSKVSLYVHNQRYINNEVPHPTNHYQSPNPYLLLYSKGLI